VGEDGSGTLTVFDPGTVELLGSEIYTQSFIMEPDATFTHHDGTLTVDGGTFDPGTADYAIDGAAPGDLPTIKLINAATATLTGNLTVGQSQAEVLEIRSDADVSNWAGFLGQLAGSSGTVRVEGAGSTWTNSDDLYVGDAGTGQLTIQSGGAVSNTIGFGGRGVVDLG